MAQDDIPGVRGHQGSREVPGGTRGHKGAPGGIRLLLRPKKSDKTVK